MALTLASNAITFTDSTSLSSGIVGTAQLSAGAVTTDKIASNSVTLDKISQSSGPFSFRNKIINGNFDIWQRGTSFNAANVYGADRWYNGRVGSTCTMSRESFAFGQTDVPNQPEYFCRMTVTSSPSSGHYVALVQPVEYVKTLAGRNATVSFYAKADASKPIALELVQDFGNGGSSFSPAVSISIQKFNLTTSWQKFTATVSIPSVFGKTLGSNNNDKLFVFFFFDAGSDYNFRANSLGQQSGTFDIAQVQLEEGSVATPFELKPIGLELSLCQRYFQKSVSVTSRAIFQGYCVNGFGYTAQINFATPMRIPPQMSVTNSEAVGFPATVGNVFSDEIAFTEARTANSTQNSGYFISSWTANAEL